MERTRFLPSFSLEGHGNLADVRRFLESVPIDSFKKLERIFEFCFDMENKEMIILGHTNSDFSSKVADELLRI